MYSKIRHCFFMVCTVYCANANATIPSSEREALISLYNQTSGVNWVNNTGWLGKSGTECQWFGVFCLGNDHVIHLALTKNGLTGTIPASIELLPQLEILDLSGNQISGSIVKELGKLTLLKTLSLSGNQLSRSIPRALGQLSQLEDLGLDINYLSGVIPEEIGQLSHLKILDLDENQLTGNLPKELGQLSSLQRLSLSNNKIIGAVPNELNLLSKLDSLELFNNCLDFGFFDSFALFDLLDLLFVPGSVKNLDLGDQNVCSDDQSKNIPIVITSENYNIYIPSIDVEGESYEVNLSRYNNPLDENGWYWSVGRVKLIDKSEKKPEIPPVSYDSITSEVTFHKIHLGRQIINVTFNLYRNLLDTSRGYFQFIP